MLVGAEPTHSDSHDMSRNNDEWLADLRAERESALSDLRELLLRNLGTVLSNRAADVALLEDVVQDSLIRILERLDQFAGRSQFLTWATSIAIRVAFSELRRSRWRDVSLDDVMSEANFLPELAIEYNSSPDARLERQAILESMQSVIQNDLTERQRTALLAEIKGMPQDEIARHLSSNRNAVYKLTHDARKKLKKGLEAAGYNAADVVATS
jgi:RNA polymerase sigma-70 factor (ECF subfamily)